MRAETRWMMLALAVIVVVAVASWPRSHDVSPSGVGSSRAATGSDVDSLELSRLAARAALAPCPRPPAGPPPAGDLVGITAPCLGTTDEVDVGAALAGQPTLINLWASWCAPCRQEIPVLEAYASELGAIRVVGINVQDQQSAALILLAELGAHYPAFGDADAVQRALAAPPVLPLSFLVHPDGTVDRVTTTLVFHDPAQVRDAVASLTR